MPPTRYQGSKRRLLPWIWENIRNLDFHTVLDAFSGSGCVSHWLKTQGKAVTCNDLLTSNYLTGFALIENSRHRLSPDHIERILQSQSGRHYDDFIERTFRNIYFLDRENRWLDRLCQNIPTLKSPHFQALAWYALFQSAVAKRPYNLFHRRNLYMRTADVKRTFGNKATWDRPFDEHFRAFAAAANDAVFDSHAPCRALCQDALSVTGRFDLVYIDPPYIGANGVGVDYFAFYHFLEGMADYAAWPNRIDYASRHRRLTPIPNPWTDRSRVFDAFRQLFHRFATSSLVVSYRSDGIPSISQLSSLLREVKPRVAVREFGRYKYALSTNTSSRETLLIATD